MVELGPALVLVCCFTVPTIIQINNLTKPFPPDKHQRRTQFNHRPPQYKQHFGRPTTTTTPTVHSSIVVIPDYLPAIISKCFCINLVEMLSRKYLYKFLILWI